MPNAFEQRRCLYPVFSSLPNLPAVKPLISTKTAFRVLTPKILSQKQKRIRYQIHNHILLHIGAPNSRITLRNDKQGSFRPKQFSSRLSRIILIKPYAPRLNTALTHKGQCSFKSSPLRTKRRTITHVHVRLKIHYGKRVSKQLALILLNRTICRFCCCFIGFRSFTSTLSDA